MTEAEYEAAVAEVDRILDQVSEAPEDTARLVALSDAIQAYEDAHVPALRGDHDPG